MCAIPGRSGDEASDIVITGMISMFHQPASALFDPGSTFSYISTYFASRLGLCSEYLSVPLCVATLVGDSLVVDRVYRSCLVTIRI